MDTIRIPIRYQRPFLRLNIKERAWVLESLFTLALGKNVEVPNDESGDLLLLIWRDCVQMERKNGKIAEGSLGECVEGTGAGDPPTYLDAEVKGSEVKGKERKGILCDFENFWKEYPKKVGKGEAEKSWNKLKPSIDTVIKTLSWQKESDQWVHENGKYVPNPATYLNQQRWLDENKNIPVKTKVIAPYISKTLSDDDNR